MNQARIREHRAAIWLPFCSPRPCVGVCLDASRCRIHSRERTLGSEATIQRRDCRWEQEFPPRCAVPRIYTLCLSGFGVIAFLSVFRASRRSTPSFILAGWMQIRCDCTGTPVWGRQLLHHPRRNDDRTVFLGHNPTMRGAPSSSARPLRPRPHATAPFCSSRATGKNGAEEARKRGRDCSSGRAASVEASRATSSEQIAVSFCGPRPRLLCGCR